jgi:hypothetical protein
VTPQPVLIYGVPCLLQRAANNGGGTLTNYLVTNPAGAVLAQQASRFLAVAKAAEALREGRK